MHISVRDDTSTRTARRRPGRAGSWFVALVLSTTAMAGLPATANGQGSKSGPGPCSEAVESPALEPSATATVGPVATPAPAPPSTGVRPLGGEWRRIARAPFASWQGVGAWTGSRAIVVAPDRHRAASYDPVHDRWRPVPRPPRLFPSYGEAFWTGTEVVFVGEYPSGDDSKAATVGAAYDPRSRTWRRLPRSPLGAYQEAAWAGGRIVVATSSDARGVIDGLGSYDLAGDCWSVLTVPPMLTDWHLVAAGDHMVAYGNDFPSDAPRTVAVMDMATLAWGPLMTSPLDADAAALRWIGGDRLLTMAGLERDEGLTPPGLLDATFDVATGVWDPVTTTCPMNTNEAVWTGRLMLGGAFAFDPATGDCFAVPRGHDRNRRDPLRLWTGRGVLTWSGGRGEEIPPRPDGIVYSPPAWATEPVVDPVGREVLPR